MLKMAKKPVVLASSFIGVESFEAVDVVDVSDSDWEVVDPSESDDDKFSYDGDSTDNDGKDADVVDAVVDPVGHPFGSPSSDVSMEPLADEIDRQLVSYAVNKNRFFIGEYHLGDYYDYNAKGEGGGYDYDEDEDEDDNCDYGDEWLLDDELVPKWVNNRFERQRMRKLGKRAYPKMNKSKKMGYQLNKPGCVYGKHGLGLEHNLVV